MKKAINRQPTQALRPVRRRTRPTTREFLAWRLRIAKQVIESGGRCVVGELLRTAPQKESKAA